MQAPRHPRRPLRPNCICLALCSDNSFISLANLRLLRSKSSVTLLYAPRHQHNGPEWLAIDGFISFRLICYHVTVSDLNIWHKVIIYPVYWGKGRHGSEFSYYKHLQASYSFLGYVATGKRKWLVYHGELRAAKKDGEDRKGCNPWWPF